MANIKITDLVALTDPATTDVLPVVDIANDETKKVAVGEIVGKISGDVDVATDGTSSIAAGVIFDADVNASAAIAGTKIDPDFGSQTVETTGVINAGSGTEAAPAVTVGSTDNGLYSPGTDQVAISTNGTGRLFIDADGNVGVGRIVTGIPLTAAQDGSGEKHPFIVTNSNVAANNGAGIYFAPSNSVVGASIMCIAESDFSTSANRDGALSFRTRLNGSDLGTSERLRITSDGKVGLGTSSPSSSALLDVADRIAVAEGSAATPSLHSRTDTNTGVNLVGTDRLSLVTAGSNRLFIDASGNVGIGTTTPGTLLHLKGTTPVLTIEAAADTQSGYLSFVNTSGNTKGFVGYDFNVDSLMFRANGTERARIDSDGRLLVGTSSQSGGSLLQVNDDRIRIASSKTPASASDTGAAGEICWDANYIYVCTATDTWKRAALSTW